MIDDLLRGINDLARSFQERLSVKAIYGEPISANGVTIVPVARIAFGFGGGGGGAGGTTPGLPGSSVEAPPGGSGGGGGGGGGGGVVPVGYVEITANGSRWVAVEKSPAEQALRLASALVAALPIGGRRGLLARLAFFVMAQAALSTLFRARMPSLPEMPFVDRSGPGA